LSSRTLTAALAGALALAAIAAPAALADSASTQTIAAGQTAPFSLPAGNGGCDGAQLFTLSYPGDSSNLTIDAQFAIQDSTIASALGFNVWDSSGSMIPNESVTLANSLKTSATNTLEFNYSSGTPGRVTIELFNWAKVPVSGSMTVVALPSNGMPLQASNAKPSGAC
jgi:hypothetical protein